MEESTAAAHLPSIAATLGSILAGKKGCSVKFKPGITTAQTNGKEVELPCFVQQGTEDDAVVLRCFLAHEICGHVLHTDFQALTNWARTGQGQTAFAKGVQNILEDGRIEKAAWLIYAGVRVILQQGVAVLTQRGFFGPEQPLDTMKNESLVQCLLLRLVRGEQHLGQGLEYVHYEAALKQRICPEVVDQIIALALQGAKSQNVVEVCEATDQIMALLRQEQEDQKEQSQPEKKSDDDGEDSKEGNPAESESEGDSSNNGDADDADSDEAKPSKPFELDESQSDDTDISDAASGLIASYDETEREIPVVDIDLAYCVPFVPMAGVVSAASRLSARLEAQLLSVNDAGDTLGQHGRLNSRKLVRGMMGDANIFSLPGEEKDGLSTALSIVIDNSGSMADIISETVSTAYALAMSLSKFDGQGVRYEVLAFSDTLRVVKPFGKAFGATKNAFSFIVPEDKTYFQPTLLAVTKRLSVQREKRKIALFLTDGDLGRDPRVAIDELRKAGIEVRLLFLGVDVKVAKMYAESAGVSNWGAASSVTDIVSGVFDAMKGAFV